MFQMLIELVMPTCIVLVLLGLLFWKPKKERNKGENNG